MQLSTVPLQPPTQPDDSLPRCLTINREKQLKKGHHDWKINRIKELNPEMEDLAQGWYIEQNEMLVIADRAHAKAYFEKRNGNSHTDPETSSG